MTETLGHTGPATSPDDYEILDRLDGGEGGGQGYVFRGVVDTDRLGPGLRGREVAVKQLSTGAVGVGRIEEFSEIVQARRHRYLSRQLEVFRGPAPRPRAETPEDDDLLYVVSELVPGTRLDALAPSASLDQVLTWIRQVAEAVDHLHADVHDGDPLLHRDIKPSNIIVRPDGDAVLIDPGLARPTTAGATATPWGSPGYVPPETVEGAGAGAASDRWQLAATLVAILVGQPPGTGPDLDELRRRLGQRLDRDLADPEPLVTAILCMLAADPSARPQSAAAWASQLVAAAATGTRRRRIPASQIAAAVALACLMLALGAVVRDLSDGTDPVTDDASSALSVSAIVDNRVTDGSEMREDTPAYLSRVTENFCRPNGCDVPDTDLASGDRLTLVCQTLGQRTTNGDDTATDDDDNPLLHESRLWYYAVHANNEEGFISEAWIAPDYRGGMGLPLC